MNAPTLKSLSAGRLEDDQYYENAIKIIQTSIHICLASIFIIDHGFELSLKKKIDSLIYEMSCANWRGVNTKLIIGGSRTNDSILIPSLAAKARAQELGVDVKIASSIKDQNSHVKLLIADDKIITGSHNWSGALSGNQTQDSVLVESQLLANKMINYFEYQWESIPKNYYDVSI